MTQPTAQPSPVTIGLDVGDRNTHYCVLDAAKSVVARDSCPTTQTALSKTLSAFGGARVALEAGSQSPWMSRQLRREGFLTHVVDPRRVQLISKDPRRDHDWSIQSANGSTRVSSSCRKRWHLQPQLHSRADRSNAATI